MDLHSYTINLNNELPDNSSKCNILLQEMSNHFVNVKLATIRMGLHSYTIKLDNKQSIFPRKSIKCNNLLQKIFQEDSDDIYGNVYNPEIDNKKYNITVSQFTELYTNCLLYD